MGVLTAFSTRSAFTPSAKRRRGSWPAATASIEKFHKAMLSAARSRKSDAFVELDNIEGIGLVVAQAIADFLPSCSTRLIYRKAASPLLRDTPSTLVSRTMTMPVWRLIPIDLDDRNWEASSHRGFVIVRAPSEASARKAAEEAFGIPTRFPPGKGLRVPPWLRSEIVRAEIIDNPVYPVEGPTEILEPFFD